MHSPDADSSDSSRSDSPPPEESFPTSSGTGSNLLSLASHISSFSGSSSKRRLPGGSSFTAGSSSRDAKSRRREDPRRTWEGKEGGAKREKEELVDNHIVDYLRKELGDPFNETAFKSAS